MKKNKISIISMYHYIRLIIRCVALAVLTYYYIFYKIKDGVDIYTLIAKYPIAFYIIFAMFIVEMIFRFFPSSLESPGCQKQFRSNYVKTGKTEGSLEL